MVQSVPENQFGKKVRHKAKIQANQIRVLLATDCMNTWKKWSRIRVQFGSCPDFSYNKQNETKNICNAMPNFQCRTYKLYMYTYSTRTFYLSIHLYVVYHAHGFLKKGVGDKYFRNCFLPLRHTFDYICSASPFAADTMFFLVCTYRSRHMYWKIHR